MSGERKRASRFSRLDATSADTDQAPSANGTFQPIRVHLPKNAAATGVRTVQNPNRFRAPRQAKNLKKRRS
jgi:hypothetical protein